MSISKKLIALALLLPTFAHAQSFPITIGAPMDQASGASSTTITENGAIQVSCAFVPARSKTVNSLQFFVSAVAGTPLSTDFRTDILADSAGNPTSTSLGGGTAGSAPTASSFPTITGLSVAVTGGTRYHAVVKNNAAAASGRTFTLRYPSSGSNAWQFPYAGQFGGGSHLWGWNNRISSDSGATWGNLQNSPSPCVRVCYSDSTCEGYAASTHINDSGNEIRGTQEAGIKCVIPASYPTTNLMGASFLVNVSGTAPAGGARVRYYLGSTTTPTLTATGVTVPAANISTGTTNPFFFSTPQAITAGSTIRIMLGAASGGSAGNAFTLSESRNDGTSNSTNVHPITCVNTITTDGVNFTDDTSLTAASLILDAGTPFTVSAGTAVGGSRLNQVLN